jgi:hypothetical protein
LFTFDINIMQNGDTHGGDHFAGVARLTLMDSFNKTSTYTKDPEIGFGTGSRPPLMIPTTTPGPGAYQIKTTLHKTIDSTIKSPEQYTIRSRHKFGDPNERALSKTSANEPGPGQYDLNGKFINGANSEKYSFPKTKQLPDKSALAPGPGTYKTPGSMGKQPLSTKKRAVEPGFPLAPRPSLVQVGTTEIGPGEYGVPPAACDVQIDSRKPTCASIRFGGGYTRNKNKIEKVDLSEPSPGPGSYVLPGGVATRSTGAPYRSSPAASLSGRNTFGSPW